MAPRRVTLMPPDAEIFPRAHLSGFMVNSLGPSMTRTTLVVVLAISGN